MPTFCQIPVIEPKNTLATKAPAVAAGRTAPLSPVCRALFTGLFLSFYAACSNQSDMDFLLHQRDLPGVAKRLTLADILRHEIDLRAGPNLQRVASRSSPGHSQVGRLQRSPSSNLVERTASAPATALAAGTSSPRNSCVSQVLAVPPVPARRLSQPCPPSHALPLLLHCHPAACPRRACRNRVGTCQCRGRLARRASMRPRCLPCDLARAAHCAASCVAHCAPIPGNA